MDPKILDKVCKRIYRQFPEVKGSRPKISSQAQNHLLIFQGGAKTPDGQLINRTVRVVVNSNGKVVKVTTSR